MLYVNWKHGGLFDIYENEWYRHRSYLNHTVLGNYFRWALTPDRTKYAEAAIEGLGENMFEDIDEKADFSETKKRIEEWPKIKSELLNHAKKVTSGFNPYSSGFNLISSSLSQADIVWLQELVQKETSLKFRLEQWIDDVETAMQKIDSALDMAKIKKSTIREIRTATDELIEIFSGKGYFTYA